VNVGPALGRGEYCRHHLDRPDAWLVPNRSDDGQGAGGDYLAAGGRSPPVMRVL
jgi:hypothetical protein